MSENESADRLHERLCEIVRGYESRLIRTSILRYLFETHYTDEQRRFADLKMFVDDKGVFNLVAETPSDHSLLISSETITLLKYLGVTRMAIVKAYKKNHLSTRIY